MTLLCPHKHLNLFPLQVNKNKQSITTTQKYYQTSLHNRKHVEKTFGKNSTNYFCHFLNMTAVKTLSEQFPEFQNLPISSSEQVILLLNESFL